MADSPKPESKPEPKAAPGVTPANQPVVVVDPHSQILTLKSPVPFTPPPVPETPPGGKFGIRSVHYEDGKVVEEVRYVNAHGLPFDEDPDKNLRNKVQRD